ncbi:MAG: alginate export family protein, partial [Pseudomonadota bacterium]|nr:alginate export family protein [Pseudomonadota bacterium]
MKFYWGITLASAIGLLPLSSVHADVNRTPSGKSLLIQPRAQQIGQAGASAANKKPAKSADENFKWAIKPAAPPVPRQDLYSDREYDWWEQPATKAAAKKPTSYHRRADSYATNPDSDPPRYVRNLSQIGIEAFKDITWLDIGFEFRTRYEMRHDDIRRVEGGFDNPFFIRSRAYLGIREILDPFRFAVEFQDSRVYNNRFPTTDQENNPYDLIQGYGELYFKNALGEDDRRQNRPLRFRVGRMAYETLDRRFIARNEWRNTTNSFEGFRLNLGREANDWEVDLFGMQPVKRLQTRFDQANEHLWFYGAIGHWRKWSDIITLQPYYMGQKQTADPSGHTATNRLDREIHMPSLRGYGKVGNLLDYDINFSYQFGTQGTERFDAYGYT